MKFLHVFMEHHLWATKYLIEHCQTLSPEQLKLSTPGTYGAIVPTLTHIIAEDQRLLKRLTGESSEIEVVEDFEFTLEELLDIWTSQSERWRKAVDGIEDIDVTLPPRGPWPEVPHAQYLILLEAVQHGNDHRTHVCSVLGANDVELPFLCGWKFWQSTERVKRSEALHNTE